MELNATKYSVKRTFIWIKISAVWKWCLSSRVHKLRSTRAGKNFSIPLGTLLHSQPAAAQDSRTLIRSIWSWLWWTRDSWGFQEGIFGIKWMSFYKTAVLPVTNKKACWHRCAVLQPLKDTTLNYFLLKKTLEQVQDTWIIKIHSFKFTHTLPTPHTKPFCTGIKSLSWGVKLG